METPLPPVTHAPDGWYESDIDAAIAEYFPAVFVEADAKAKPSSLLIDGRAAHRRRRRIARQTVGVALRDARMTPGGQDHEEAA